MAANDGADRGMAAALYWIGQGYPCLPFANTTRGIEPVKGARAKGLRPAAVLLEEFRRVMGGEPDGWVLLTGQKGAKGYLYAFDAEIDGVKDFLAERYPEARIVKGSKGGHILFFMDRKIKRIQLKKKDKLVLEVLSDWFCVLEGSIHRKTGKEYAIIADGEMAITIQPNEFDSLLDEIIELFSCVQLRAAPKKVDEGKKVEEVEEEIEENGDIPAVVLEILKDKKLFDRITKDELGKKVVGEVETRQAIFTCACGKYVTNANTTSFNLMANANAGAGKDYTTHATLEIFPKKDYLKRTRISPTALTYWHNSSKEPNWNWDGKILNLEDISQNVIDCDVVKVFLSSSSFATIVVNQETIDLKINGKPVVFLSSATAKLKPEQMRRIPIIDLDETSGQTKEIMKRQAEAAAEGKTLEYDENITIALGKLKRVKVKVPFAAGISEAIPATHIILRTHFPRFLDYIKAIAALYQFQRKTSEDGYLIAERQDYELAKIAMEKTTSNKFFVPLTHEQKRLIKIIEQMQEDAQKTIDAQKAQSQLLQTNGQQKLEVCELVGFDAGEIAAKVDFWAESFLYEQLNLLANCGILIHGRKEKEGSKKAVKTYRVQNHAKISLPTWGEICGNSGIDGKGGIDGVSGINGNDGGKTNNSINSITSVNSSPPLNHTKAAKEGASV